MHTKASCKKTSLKGSFSEGSLKCSVEGSKNGFLEGVLRMALQKVSARQKQVSAERKTPSRVHSAWVSYPVVRAFRPCLESGSASWVVHGCGK